jgi:hypothetical protein
MTIKDKLQSIKKLYITGSCVKRNRKPLIVKIKNNIIELSIWIFLVMLITFLLTGVHCYLIDYSFKFHLYVFKGCYKPILIIATGVFLIGKTFFNNDSTGGSSSARGMGGVF